MKRIARGSAKKLVLVVIDSLKTEMLERAMELGRAPAMSFLRERGEYVSDCVSCFPSLTPVASASIATGVGPAKHFIPSMNWYLRGERRYVEYGSSWLATRKFGVLRTLSDTVYNMNLEHLSRGVETVFERLEDAGLKTACTTFLIYRGRKRHRVSLEGVMKRVVDAAMFSHATYGPRELFYGELFHSRPTGCRPTFARPGTRDEFTGCVGAYLARNDLFDFLLFSLPDNDYHCHRFGPHASVESIGWADQNLGKMMDAVGGREEFLEDHDVIVLGDHAQTPIERRLQLVEALDGWRVLTPNDLEPERAEIAVSPGARSAMIYFLDDQGDSRDRDFAGVMGRIKRLEGIDQILWLESGEACVWSPRGEMRFAPGHDHDLIDERDNRWSVDGSHEALELAVDGGVVSSRTYPNVMERVWSSLNCPGSGEIVISAAPGYEFVDWGGDDHVGGGSHGSLHRGDSVGPLIFTGCGSISAEDRRLWTVQDVFGLILDHFELE